MTRPRIRPVVWTAVGWMGVALFVVVYGIELLPHHGRPVTLSWIESRFGRSGLILLNILIVAAFLALLPYRRPTRGVWRSRGTFVAFVIALMTEMFGWPLVLFLLAPLVEIPRIAPDYFAAVGHWPAAVGTLLSLSGLALVAIGWQRIHRARGLVTDGIYGRVRHPQYTGLMLFTLGWLLHWPSLITLALWPLLATAYVWLARREEQEAIAEFGDAYREYASRTRRFLPGLV